MLYSHPDISSKMDCINKELLEISNWFKANKLSVNASKTNYMVMGTQHTTNGYIDINGSKNNCRNFIDDVSDVANGMNHNDKAGKKSYQCHIG